MLACVVCIACPNTVCKCHAGEMLENEEDVTEVDDPRAPLSVEHHLLGSNDRQSSLHGLVHYLLWPANTCVVQDPISYNLG